MTVRGLDKGERPALLISECQRGMLDDELRGQRDELARNAAEKGIVPAIAELAEAFRQAHLPVIHSHIVPRSDWSGFRVNCVLAGVLKRTNAVADGRPGAGPVAGLEPKDGDYWVRRKTGMTSFCGTEIDAVLRAEDVRTVVMTGVSTNVAVYGSTIEATNLGYNVVLPMDCVVGVGQSQHVVAEQLLPLLATITDRQAVMEALATRSSAVGVSS